MNHSNRGYFVSYEAFWISKKTIEYKKTFNKQVKATKDNKKTPLASSIILEVVSEIWISKNDNIKGKKKDLEVPELLLVDSDWSDLL